MEWDIVGNLEWQHVKSKCELDFAASQMIEEVSEFVIMSTSLER